VDFTSAIFLCLGRSGHRAGAIDGRTIEFPRKCPVDDVPMVAPFEQSKNGNETAGWSIAGWSINEPFL
jgi:hypothetical protein